MVNYEVNSHRAAINLIFSTRFTPFFFHFLTKAQGNKPARVYLAIAASGFAAKCFDSNTKMLFTLSKCSKLNVIKRRRHRWLSIVSSKLVIVLWYRNIENSNSTN